MKNQLKQFWNGPTNVSHHIIQILEIGEEKILFAPHHISHVLSAIPYQRINLEETALHFVFDAVGDGICSSIFSGTPTKLEILNQNQHPHSIGFFYSAITEFCGFNINEGEFKLMALAAYGKPIYADFILNNLIKFSTHSIKLNLDWFNC